MFLLLLLFSVIFNSVTFCANSNTANYPTLNDRESCSVNVTTSDTKNEAIATNLATFQEYMKANSIDAYIIPWNNEHQTSDDRFRRLEVLSKFSGSSGTAVVLQSEAALWTDGRYFIQAEEELDCNWILMKQGIYGVPHIHQWLVSKLVHNSSIMADSKVISYNKWEKWDEIFKSADIKLIPDDNLLNSLTKSGPLDVHSSPIFVYDVKYAGLDWQTKVQRLKETLAWKNIDGIVISSLDEIAWLFNLRGHDVQHTPLFYAYAYLSHDTNTLYVEHHKVTEEVRLHLNSSSIHVDVRDYQDSLEDISNTINKTNGKVLVTSSSSMAVVNLVPSTRRVVQYTSSPISDLRAVKDAVEINGMKRANVKDAVAIIEFIAVLEEEVIDGKQWDELKASTVLSAFRKEQDLNQGESFESICASGANAAKPHYRPHSSTNKNITTDQIFLLDSGGQYLDGTIDITRTFHFGQPTEFQKETYTRVLLGAIDLMTTFFPKGVRDIDVDIIARRPLYEIGLNYMHGTGHGIGTYMGVHEKPILIRNPSLLQTGGFVLKPGMFTSIEPGFYQDGEFGIRLETVAVVVEANTTYQFAGVPYYTFEPVTLVPFEPKLIKVELLSKKQKQWLNDYNFRVRETVGQELLKQRKLNGYKWLISKIGLV